MQEHSPHASFATTARPRRPLADPDHRAMTDRGCAATVGSARGFYVHQPPAGRTPHPQDAGLNPTPSRIHQRDHPECDRGLETLPLCVWYRAVHAAWCPRCTRSVTAGAAHPPNPPPAPTTVTTTTSTSTSPLRPPPPSCSLLPRLPPPSLPPSPPRSPRPLPGAALGW